MSKWALFEDLLDKYVDTKLALIFAIGTDVEENKEDLKEEIKDYRDNWFHETIREDW